MPRAKQSMDGNTAAAHVAYALYCAEWHGLQFLCDQ